GEGKLTTKVIGDLTIYYGLAIRKNPDAIEKMKNDIWATYFHMSSSNENPIVSASDMKPRLRVRWHLSQIIKRL
ncbi:hypothetical protein WH47_01699, partial [Habropoda laboriosa]